MASNNGRGPSRPADFLYTDTVADKGTLQGVLVKQDDALDRVNAISTFLGIEASNDYNGGVGTLSNSVGNISTLNKGVAAFNAGFINISPSLGGTQANGGEAAGATSITVDSTADFGATNATGRLFVARDADGNGFYTDFTVASATELTVAATLLVIGDNNSVFNIAPSVIASVPTALVKVDVKN